MNQIMKEKIKKAHMEAAYAYSKASTCVRRKVGCIIVDGDRTVSIGYNGTPPGEDNVCEIDPNTTKPNVIHAEANALNKLGNEAEGMSLFCTSAPCFDCAELIMDAKISHVYYHEVYRNSYGIERLIDNDVPVTQIQLD
jgi:dCMP deaminase